MPSHWDGDINDPGLCEIELFKISNVEGRGEEQKLLSKGPNTNLSRY